MRKFKHVKLGHIAELASHERNYNITYNKEIEGSLPKWAIENSADWVELKEDEYPKIISFRSQQLDTIYDRRGEYFFEKDRITGSITEQFLLQPFYEIYQVAVDKGIILTVGDKISATDNKYWDGTEYINVNSGKWVPSYYNTTIKEFKVIPEGILCIFSVKNSGYNNFGQLVQHIKKVESIKPTLTTFDNQELYTGDTVWNLNTEDWKYSKFTINLNYQIYIPLPNYKLFANKEKMLEYIDENKPSISKKQVEKALDNVLGNYIDGDEIYARIKQKLGI